MARFDRHTVCPDTGCWLFLGYLARNGYGGVSGGLAHRTYYEHFKGAIPDGLVLDHRCRNKACVNPDHLEAVTQAENVRRGQQTTLTAEDAVAIRESTGTLREVAEEYGITKSSVSKIRCGHRWAA